MFTGIIQQQAKIIQIIPQKAGVEFSIASQYADLQLGESIAVNGVCLTVTKILPDAAGFCCQLSPETLHVSMMQHLREGDVVNLERALLASDRLGGHFVLGHVDAEAQVVKFAAQGEYWQLHIAIESSRYKPAYVLPKGSIAVNGVSLTINQINGQIIELMIIPHTLQETNFSSLQAGSWVNIEYDYLAKVVARSVTTNVVSEC